MKTSLILGIALSVSGCMVGSNGGTSDENIIGGSFDPGDPAVAIIRFSDPSNGQGSLCTGTLVSPTVLVSAAHCVAQGGVYDVNFAAQPNLAAPYATQGWTTAAAIANPAYDGTGENGHDVSVFLLSRPQTIAPIAFGATPAVNAPVRAVGYGMNVFGHDGTGAGLRRQVNVQVDSVAAHEIVTGQEGQSSCHGDSGGPILDASGALVATTSYGEDNCHSPAHDMRIDDNLDFLGQFLGGGSSGSGSGSGGGTTTTGGYCESTVGSETVHCEGASCSCRINGQQVSTCTAANAATACSIPGDCCGF